MRGTRLGAAVVTAAMALSACSLVGSEPPAGPPSPTAPPVYPRFEDGRLCENVRYDLFEGIVTVTSTLPTQPFQEGFGLKCASNGHLLRRGQPAILLTFFIFDSPEHAQQAFQDKGIQPSPQAGVSHGTFDLAVTRSQWTATSDLLKGIVFDGNLRIEGEVYEIGPNGQSADILKRFTALMDELVKELRRMAAQVR